MRRLAVVVALALLVTGCTGRAGDQGLPGGPRQNVVPGLKTGVFPVGDREPAPTLRGQTLDGADLDVADYRGKVVVLNFWASWCAPCRAEARNLNAVYAQTKASGVEFVGVAFKDKQTAAQSFQRTKQVAYPSLFDPKGLLFLKFGGQAPQQPPTTLVLDRQGRVAALFSGPVTETQLLGPVQVLARET